MQQILVMNDNSVSALHAAEYALNLACIYNKNILIADLTPVRETSLKSYTIADSNSYQEDYSDIETGEDVFSYLDSLLPCHDFQPEISRLDITTLNEQDLINCINLRNVWMVIQGVTGENLKCSPLDLQAVLNRVQCPFLLVPREAVGRPLERLVYLADLRYAQVPVINFLAKMNSHQESVILAHICAQGLPELDNSYALDLFSNGLNRNTSCERLFFSHLRQKNFTACVDQVINGMQADLLVCVNHHYHFEQLLAGNILAPMPGYINIPLLVFPH